MGGVGGEMGEGEEEAEEEGRGKDVGEVRKRRMSLSKREMVAMAVKAAC